jgi:hypothetical protein
VGENESAQLAGNYWGFDSSRLMTIQPGLGGIRQGLGTGIELVPKPTLDGAEARGSSASPDGRLARGLRLSARPAPTRRSRAAG